MIRRLLALSIALLALLGCTTASDGVAAVDPIVVAPASASVYSLDIIDLGEPERFPVVLPVPVGRQANITVSLTSLGDAIDVSLVATVIQAGADGRNQLVELEVVGVEAVADSTVDALVSIVGASSSLVRDERLAVVEQTLDVPTGLAFRADAVVRQALRAPFSLVGPMTLESVGPGASWTVDFDEGADAADTLLVAVVNNSSDGFDVRFEVADGVAEITGRPGTLLPDQQLITLDNAALRVVAERAN